MTTNIININCYRPLLLMPYTQFLIYDAKVQRGLLVSLNVGKTPVFHVKRPDKPIN